MNRTRTAKQQRKDNRGNGPGFLGMEELGMLMPAQLTWERDQRDKQRLVSSAGHTITGVALCAVSQKRFVYNCWTGKPHASRHLEQGFDAEGLARCKAAAEREFAGRSK